MKKLTLVLFLFSLCKLIFCQTEYKLYSAEGIKKSFYILETDSSSIVYTIALYKDNFGDYPYFQNSDTIKTSGNFIESDNFYLEKSKDVISLSFKNSNKKLRLEPIFDLNEMKRFKTTIWESSFLQMKKELLQEFPLAYFDHLTLSNQNIFLLEEMKLDIPQTQLVSDSINDLIKEQIIALQYPQKNDLDEITNTIDSIEYKRIKEIISNFSTTTNAKSYFRESIQLIGEKNPTWIYQLAEDMPNQKEKIFESTLQNRELIQKLKHTEYTQSIKKDYTSYRRGNTINGIIGVTVVTTIVAAEIVAIGLLVHLIAK